MIYDERYYRFAKQYFKALDEKEFKYADFIIEEMRFAGYGFQQVKELKYKYLAYKMYKENNNENINNN